MKYTLFQDFARKSHARRRRPAIQGPPSQAIHREFGYGPLEFIKKNKCES